jgi:hypothetical protein
MSIGWRRWLPEAREGTEMEAIFQRAEVSCGTAAKESMNQTDRHSRLSPNGELANLARVPKCFCAGQLRMCSQNTRSVKGSVGRSPIAVIDSSLAVEDCFDAFRGREPFGVRTPKGLTRFIVYRCVRLFHRRGGQNARYLTGG